jgi:hypothetical protein
VKESFINVFDGESALCFNGRDGGVNCGATPSLSLTDAATIEAWICPEGWGEVQGTGAGRIVDKTNIALYLNGTGNAYAPHSLILLLRNVSGPPRVCCTPESSIVLGGWQHVAATYSSSTGQACMYINGVEQAVSVSSQPSGAIRDNTNEALIIGNGSAQNYTFDGTIDEVRVWNTVRSGPEISTAMGGYLQGSEPGLVGYWRMNEGNGAALADETSGANDGALIAGMWVLGTPFEPTASGEGAGPSSMPMDFSLLPTCPNPADGPITIRFEVPRPSGVRVLLCDIGGRVVCRLVDDYLPKGTHSVTWNARGDDGIVVAPGVYVVHMAAGSFAASRPCVVLR